MRVLLGCGGGLQPGWLSIDGVRAHPEGPGFLCRDPFDLDGHVEDGGADRIVDQGVLGRTPWREIDALLVVLARKLRPGGTLTLHLVDGEAAARAFAAGELPHHQAQRLLFGDQGAPEDTRRSLWSVAEARRRLKTVGLEVERVARRGYRLKVRGRRLA